MWLIKDVARRILANEIRKLKEDRERFESRNIELRGKIAELENKLVDNGTEVAKVDSERILAERRTKELEKENEILRQYYDLDKEPSDEIKAKIHIDLEINRLKEEKNDLKNEVLRLMATNRQTPLIPPPYQYGFCGRLF